MYKWSAFPFIRLSIALSAGIILSSFDSSIWETYSPYIVSVVIGVVGIANWLWIRRPVIKGILFLGSMIYLGGLLAILNTQDQMPTHYSQIGQADGFVGVVISDHSERKKYNRYDVEVREVQRDSVARVTSGKIHLYVSKGHEVLSYGDVVVVPKAYFEVSSPKNPNEFDYRKYLERQNIYAHAFVSGDEIKVIDHQPPSRVLDFALGLRVAAQKKIEEFVPVEREQAIVSALILGIKDHIDSEVKTAYASAGAIHVLAVSGLHVGILFLLIQIICKPWKERSIGRFVFMFLSLSIIWMYALVTGFSPSVVRAATMFSVVIISKSFKRKSNIYNSLGIAAFLLILYDPFVIYAVGFQLSFAAVFGIVLIHPLLYHKLTFYNKVSDYIWSITCVSIAAQIATFPLTLLYFNQFPTYFLVSNLIVIPAAFLMLLGGILMLVIGSVWAFAGQVLGFVFQLFVYCVNESMLALQYLPHPLIDWLYFDWQDAVLVYGAILILILAFTKYDFHLLKLAAFFCLVMISWSHFKTVLINEQKKVIFYEIEGITAIDLIAGHNAMLLVDTLPPDQMEVLSYQINPFRLANGLAPVAHTLELLNDSELVRASTGYKLIYWEGQRILLTDELENCELQKDIKADIVIIKEPKDMWDNLQAKTVLLGNGFRYYEVQKALDYYKSSELAVHSLPTDGYWELDLSKRKSVINQMAALIH